ncbi:hypothetical protein PAQ31011_05143 [Pandoraea aquatica]|uniref:Uncharacterized protein n=1 Tax=Pandoraea aquatica TaxID=2508290 RepID=A0A5E4Z8Z6_9BURK|nr:hypothetical protein [Pandoraea aquatica]VVE56790.1 hypothetical protein PAQ31011_05143 [Pandoraea aquatica]
MAYHTLQASLDVPNMPGFIQHVYATVEVIMSGAGWVWIQVIDGRHHGSHSAPFASEDLAKDDALTALGGDCWL